MQPLVGTKPRTIVHRTLGSTHGPVTRLISPGDLGQILKPFVFLDRIDSDESTGQANFAMHPHSGIATLTFMTEGEGFYRDSTGKTGVLQAGGVEWMSAGMGVWHTGGPLGGTPVRGFQLWVALPPRLENAPAHSIYQSPEEVPVDGPARVLLGSYGKAQSRLPAPSSVNLLCVTLKDRERWRYCPPEDHVVAWIVVHSGQLDAGGKIGTGQLAVFEESTGVLDCEATGDTTFVLGSASKHPYPLFTGRYSVHTNPSALATGEAEIQRLGARLRAEGQLG